MSEEDKPPPWLEPRRPAKGERVKLTEASIALARARAKAAGRRYPNLVDNMWAASQQRAQEVDRDEDDLIG